MYFPLTPPPLSPPPGRKGSQVGQPIWWSHAECGITKEALAVKAWPCKTNGTLACKDLSEAKPPNRLSALGTPYPEGG